MSDETFTVIVFGLGFWGCGNTYNEAVANARKQRGFNPHKAYHRVICTTRPVHSVVGSIMGVQWEWAGEQGESTFIDINDEEEAM